MCFIRTTNSPNPGITTAMLVLVFGVAGLAIGALAPGDCVDFEDLTPYTTYGLNDTFTDSGVSLTPGLFQNGGGAWTPGTATVGIMNEAGGSGNEIRLDQSTVDFDFGTKYGRFDLLFGETGGNINLRVNGVLANVEDMTELHSTTLGGASIVVQPLSGFTGQLIVTGPIETFSIGGQELWIDHVCISNRAMFNDGFEFGNTNAWSVTLQ